MAPEGSLMIIGIVIRLGRILVAGCYFLGDPLWRSHISHIHFVNWKEIAWIGCRQPLDYHTWGPHRELEIHSNTLVKCCVNYELHGHFLIYVQDPSLGSVTSDIFISLSFLCSGSCMEYFLMRGILDLILERHEIELNLVGGRLDALELWRLWGVSKRTTAISRLLRFLSQIFEEPLIY